MLITSVTSLQSVNAQTDDVTVAFTGRVTDIGGGGSSIFKSQIRVGDTVNGMYVYNYLTEDSNDDPTVGDYLHNANPYGITVKIGKIVFRSDPGHLELELVNRETDHYVVQSSNNLPLSKKILISHISLQLDDNSGQAFSSDSLQQSPRAPDLSKWEQSGLLIAGECSIKYDKKGECGELFTIVVQVTDVRLVN